jgi:hypothetical protein
VQRGAPIRPATNACAAAVKFTDPETGLQCDLNVNEQLGLRNSALLDAFCDLAPVLRPLVAVLKLWARELGLNDPAGQPPRGGVRRPATFSSYALTLMAVGWLQRTGALPSMQAAFAPLAPDGPATAPHVWWHRTRGYAVRCDTRWRRPPTFRPRAEPSEVDVLSNLRGWFAFWAEEFDYAESALDVQPGGGVVRKADVLGTDEPVSPPPRPPPEPEVDEGERGFGLRRPANAPEEPPLGELQGVLEPRGLVDSALTRKPEASADEVAPVVTEVRADGAEEDAEIEDPGVDDAHPVYLKQAPLCVMDPFIRTKVCPPSPMPPPLYATLTSRRTARARSRRPRSGASESSALGPRRA